ncbi:hypothetical protein J1605_000681 [Eschrichtius robustus]|uniref:Uncharacterized protein n=1 Tax=Eschrichtius robustus TaxID=9764 RepID=A0AB34GNC2_ESCRO|nr:hypothetical protein J1605_000681 [Eschrichtius robustus]
MKRAQEGSHQLPSPPHSGLGVLKLPAGTARRISGACIPDPFISRSAPRSELGFSVLHSLCGDIRQGLQSLESRVHFCILLDTLTSSPALAPRCPRDPVSMGGVVSLFPA